MASSEESNYRLRDEPVSPLQLVTHIMYVEEEVRNAKRMRIVEEEVSLSLPKTATVPPEEEEVPLEEEVPPEKEEFLAPAVVVP
jgi:hypothetical protein